MKAEDDFPFPLLCHLRSKQLLPKFWCGSNPTCCHFKSCEVPFCGEIHQQYPAILHFSQVKFSEIFQVSPTFTGEAKWQLGFGCPPHQVQFFPHGQRSSGLRRDIETLGETWCPNRLRNIEIIYKPINILWFSFWKNNLGVSTVNLGKLGNIFGAQYKLPKSLIHSKHWGGSLHLSSGVFDASLNRISSKI